MHVKRRWGRAGGPIFFYGFYNINSTSLSIFFKKKITSKLVKLKFWRSIFGVCDNKCIVKLKILKRMADINNLFDCFEENERTEAAVQFPNVKKEEEKA